jgi:hypothetical protein
MAQLDRLVLASTLFLLQFSHAVYAHMPVPRQSEEQDITGRLFAADAANGEVISVDLPDGALARLRTPPFIMGMALTSDKRHLFAMRGRTTDRDWITVIYTGFEPTSTKFRPPHHARTFLGSNTNLGDAGQMYTVGGQDAIFLEGVGEVVIFEDNDFSSLDAVPTRRFKVAAPAHLHYMEVGENLYFGHLSEGFVQVLHRDTGAEVARITNCPEVHGRFYDEPSGRIFYPCHKDLLVIGTRDSEANKVVARLDYPGEQRIGSFLRGKDRIRWGFTMGTMPVLYRLDASREPYVIESVPVNPSVRQSVTEDGDLLLSLTRDGVLETRDGSNGSLLRTLNVSMPLSKDPHEMLDKAILPDIEAVDDLIYVSLPHEGRIAVVDLVGNKIVRYLDVGGQPTRLLVVESAG